jgi:hexosaminidase
MKMKIFKITLAILFLIFNFTSTGYAEKPNTIPALQEWTDGSGSFSFPVGGRIVLDASYSAQLTTTGQVFQDDLLALTGMSHPVINGSQASLSPGDIFLSLSSTDTALGTEGYSLNISDRIIINAQNDAGAFYGTRTILQLLKQSNTIPAGNARDFPRYPLRALHVDNGRKFVTVGWLKNHIKELAYFKMNLFHWHLAEWNNFRLESSTHPEVVAADHYTKAQFADMMALAKKYHVNVMPEFEMPGHMGWALAKNPSLRVVDNTGYVNPDNIDLTKDASYKLISDLLKEWLPLVPGPYFHIGTDEYITDYSKFPQYLSYAQAKWGASANAKDVYFYFINWANDIVRSYGKTTWAWDDSKTGGSVFSTNKNIMLDSWTYAAQSELNQGFSLINCAQAVLYYVWYTNWEPMQTQLYETWAPHQWSYTSSGPLQPYTRGLMGAKLALWFDKNQTEEYSMAWGMKNSMRTVAQQTWASPKIYARYVDFKTLSDKLGRAPGTTFPNNQPPIVKPNGPYSSAFGSPITFSSAGTMARNGSIASYKWDFGDGGTSTQANPT